MRDLSAETESLQARGRLSGKVRSSMSFSVTRIRALTLVGALLFPLLAVAQPYPSRPIRIIVPFSAGSASDIIARTISVKLRGVIGQDVVVENRPGAVGTIGSAAAARSAPDGYTIIATICQPWYQVSRSSGLCTPRTLRTVTIL